MFYEKEIFRREAPTVPKAYQIVNLETGETYKTLASAAQSAGVTNEKMREFINDGSVWSRPSGPIYRGRKVRCVTTGEVFDSVSKAAASIPSRMTRRKKKVSTSLVTMYKHLNGETPAIKGLQFAYITPRTKGVTHDGIVRDDKGVEYGRGFARISEAKGLMYSEAKYLVNIDAERVFRDAWLGDRTFRNARFDGKWWWINGMFPFRCLSDFRKGLRMCGIRVTPEEAKRLVGDLFA